MAQPPKQLVYGFDVDGVLANFNNAFSELLISTTRENRLPAGYWADPDYPPVWHWPQHFGYSGEQIDRAWEAVKATRFWNTLEPMKGIQDIHYLPLGSRVYFITSRVGPTALRQTQLWLHSRLSFTFADRHEYSVIISSNKAASALALGLDFYIDDYPHNVNTVVGLMPNCAVYLLDAPYNRRDVTIDRRVYRARSVAEALTHFNARRGSGT